MQKGFHNPRQGEVSVSINNTQYPLKLTLSALAYLESIYDGKDILLLIETFAEQGMTATDVHNILQAGLYGAGEKQIKNIEIDGGINQAKKCATTLIENAFI